MDQELLKELQEAIMGLEEFKELYDQKMFEGMSDEDRELWYITYHGVDIGDILVMEEISTGLQDERTFFRYNRSSKRLRQVSEEEDELFRQLDDEHPLREWRTVEFIINRKWNNEIEYGGMRKETHMAEPSLRCPLCGEMMHTEDPPYYTCKCGKEWEIYVASYG